MKRIVNRQRIFGIIFTFVFIFGLFFHFLYYRNTLIKINEEKILSNVENMIVKIESDLHEKIHTIEHAASIAGLNLLDDNALLLFFQTTMETHPEFFSVYVGFEDNTMINGSGFNPYLTIPNYDVRIRPWYVQAKSSNTTVVTNPFVNSSNDYIIITIATPLYDESNHLIGIVAGDLIVNSFFDVVQQSELTENSYSFLVNQNGDFLSHPTYLYQYDASKTEQQFIDSTNIASISNKTMQALFSKQTGVTPVMLDGVNGYVAYKQLEINDWIIGTFTPIAEYSHYLDQFIEVFLITMIGIFLVSIVFFWWQRRQLTNPMLRMEQEVASINPSDDLTYRLPMNKNDPFLDVRNKINQLLTTTETFFNRVEADNQSLSTSNDLLEHTLVTLRKTEDELRIQYNQLSESEKKYKSLVGSMSQGLVLFEVTIGTRGKVEDAIVIDANNSFSEMIELPINKIMNTRLLDINPNLMQLIKSIERVMLSGKSDRFEFFDERISKHFELIVYQVSETKVATIIFDITIRKKLEEKLMDLSFKDQLTGLKNRRSYEDDLKRYETASEFPHTVLMADVNGLKLVNDSFGHDEGDKLLKKVATILTKVCGKKGSIYRIGGDEFIVSLSKTDYFETDEYVKKLKTLFSKERISGIEISVSFGWATRDFESVTMLEIIKRAEDNMYKSKLYESPSMRGKAINTVLDTLYMKSSKEKDHALGVQQLLERFAKALNLPSDKVLELSKAAEIHDIGKIIIDEAILDKKGKLTDIEFIEMKRHPEAGYRILSTLPEFVDIAQYILAHHERWDGSGYPKGLKKDDIPFESRMMAICDAYYAMTSQRSYKPKLTKEEAIKELKRCAETQFDPYLVTEFITKVLGE
ncbi:MAG TPA: diguanylate cyclase [Bacilli bacterium]|nr:diguanylate cyclase [Bacilli bacterium]